MFEAHENGDYLVQLENGVLRVSFNRPKFGNAIGQTAVPGLVQLFRDAQESVKVRSILIRGEGKIFSAGGDVAGFARSLKQDVPGRRAEYHAGCRTCVCLSKLSSPSIARLWFRSGERRRAQVYSSRSRLIM